MMDMPEEFLKIAESVYDTFMFSFDANRQETWPEETMERIKSNEHKEDEHDMPTSYEIMYVLKQKGDNLLSHLLNMSERVIKQTGDNIQTHFLELDSKQG